MLLSFRLIRFVNHVFADGIFVNQDQTGAPIRGSEQFWQLQLVGYRGQPVVECMVLGCADFNVLKRGMHWIDNVIELNWNDSAWDF